jgi:hypothetical protein
LGDRRALVAVGPSGARIDRIVLRIDAEFDIGRVGIRVGRDERGQRVVAGEIAVVVAGVVEAFVFQDKGDGRRLANDRANGFGRRAMLEGGSHGGNISKHLKTLR